MKGEVINSSFSRDSEGAFYIVQVRVPVDLGPSKAPSPPKPDPDGKVGVVPPSKREYPKPPEGEVEILPPSSRVILSGGAGGTAAKDPVVKGEK